MNSREFISSNPTRSPGSMPSLKKALATLLQLALSSRYVSRRLPDVISDGEQSKSGFSSYFGDRLNGFEKGRGAPFRRSDLIEYPEYVKLHAGVGSLGDRRMAVTGPVSWKDFPYAEQIARDWNSKAAKSQKPF